MMAWERAARRADAVSANAAANASSAAAADAYSEPPPYSAQMPYTEQMPPPPMPPPMMPTRSSRTPTRSSLLGADTAVLGDDATIPGADAAAATVRGSDADLTQIAQLLRAHGHTQQQTPQSLPPPPPPFPAASPPPMELKDAFEQADVNHDGKLSRAEFANFLKMSGMNVADRGRPNKLKVTRSGVWRRRRERARERG